MIRNKLATILVLAGFAFAVPALSQPAPARTEVIHFAPDTSSSTVKGSVKGYDFVDYIIGARAGQTLAVSLKSNLPSNYFKLMPKGDEAAIHNGTIAGNSYSGAMPKDGDYVVRVYIMRNDARRNKVASYTLITTITP